VRKRVRKEDMNGDRRREEGRDQRRVREKGKYE
jgi:hypothetical protein